MVDFRCPHTPKHACWPALMASPARMASKMQPGNVSSRGDRRPGGVYRAVQRPEKTRVFPSVTEAQSPIAASVTHSASDAPKVVRQYRVAG